MSNTRMFGTTGGSNGQHNGQTQTAPDLSEFDDAYAAAPDSDLPDGRYQVKVHTVKLDRSKKGDPLLKFDLIILDGEYIGWHLFKNNVVSRESVPVLKKELVKMGLKLERLSDLPTHLDSFIDQRWEVSKKTRDEFTNIYFVKRLAEPETEPAAAEATAATPAPDAGTVDELSPDAAGDDEPAKTDTAAADDAAPVEHVEEQAATTAVPF